ncbi:MAG: carbohydrate kinase family protein [Gammaproteobacteria bacterium]|nr:carbohydrate kinase family protein [Gammaproteobacteria bacterium]
MNLVLKKIYCIGGACIDRTLKSLSSLENGTSNPVSSFTSFGGVARNVAENLAYWTKEIHLRCAVGNDREGAALLTHMQALGVNTAGSIVSDKHNTSHFYAALNHENDLHIAFADMTIYNDISLSQLTQYHWEEDSLIFIDTNLPAEIIRYFTHQAKATACKLFVDPVSIIKAQKLTDHLENIFLLKPNLDEASSLANMKINSRKDCLKAGRILLEKGVENIVISLGKNGYAMINKQDAAFFPAIMPRHIFNVNGAGDAFIAGILYGLQQKHALIQACQYGAAAAAFTIESQLTVSQTISAEQLQKRVELYLKQ